MSVVAIAGVVVLGLALRYVLKRSRGRRAMGIGAFRTSGSGAPHLVFGGEADHRSEDQSDIGSDPSEADGSAGDSAGDGGGADGGRGGE